MKKMQKINFKIIEGDEGPLNTYLTRKQGLYVGTAILYKINEN